MKEHKIFFLLLKTNSYFMSVFHGTFIDNEYKQGLVLSPFAPSLTSDLRIQVTILVEFNHLKIMFSHSLFAVEACSQLAWAHAPAHLWKSPPLQISPARIQGAVSDALNN